MSSKLESDVYYWVALYGESYGGWAESTGSLYTAGFMACFTSRHLRADYLYRPGPAPGPSIGTSMGKLCLFNRLKLRGLFVSRDKQTTLYTCTECSRSGLRKALVESF